MRILIKTTFVIIYRDIIKITLLCNIKISIIRLVFNKFKLINART